MRHVKKKHDEVSEGEGGGSENMEDALPEDALPVVDCGEDDLAREQANIAVKDVLADLVGDVVAAAEHRRAAEEEARRVERVKARVCSI